MATTRAPDAARVNLFLCANMSSIKGTDFLCLSIANIVETLLAAIRSNEVRLMPDVTLRTVLCPPRDWYGATAAELSSLAWRMKKMKESNELDTVEVSSNND